MLQDMKEVLTKKLGALSTTQGEIDRLDANIERKRRIISKAEAEIESQLSAIEEKESKRADFSERLGFQQERIEAIERLIARAEEIEQELPKLYAEKESLSQWGMDIARMRADKEDLDSEYNIVSRKIDEAYAERGRLAEMVNAEYLKPYVKAEA